MVLSIFPIGVLADHNKFDSKLVGVVNVDKSEPEKSHKIILRWRNVIGFSFIHVFALYGLYLTFTAAKLATILFSIVLFEISQIGVTAGFHRYFSHKSYKATWQLRLILVFMSTLAFQGHVFIWARDHRTHHKFCDTDADPHNARRGLFFSHIGWLLCHKHPDVIKKGKTIDMSDLYADPILRFQKKYYYYQLMPLICYAIPSLIAVYFWNETYVNALFIAGFLRHVCVLHSTFFINSFAHAFGTRPYDKNILPVQNFIVSILTSGEGWHNYHHTFPWDYKASELLDYRLNLTNAFIDFFAWIGWAYDLKTVSPDMIKKRVHRTGDGSHEVWGWGDKDITKEDQEATITT